MNILVLEGSPHKQGSSNLLAESFITGAREAGHSVTVFDAAHASLHPCLGCNACKMNGPCVQKDGMAALRELILKSDMLVFVSPLYYLTLSAQLKIAIDRFYSFHFEIVKRHLKTALIVAANNDQPAVMASVKAYYLHLCRLMEFQDEGMILGTACGTPEMTRRTDFPAKALAFGKNLKE